MIALYVQVTFFLVQSLRKINWKKGNTCFLYIFLIWMRTMAIITTYIDQFLCYQENMRIWIIWWNIKKNMRKKPTSKLLNYHQDLPSTSSIIVITFFFLHTHCISRWQTKRRKIVTWKIYKNSICHTHKTKKKKKKHIRHNVMQALALECIKIPPPHQWNWRKKETR